MCSRDPVSCGQLDIPSHNRRLCRSRPAWQAEAAGDCSLVAAGVRAGQSRVLGVLRDNSVEGSYVLQSPPHQPGVRHTSAVVGEHPHTGPGSGHQPQFRQLRTLQALADRTNWHYLSEAIAPTEFGHVLGGLCRVGDRCGVRHGQHRGIAAPGRGRRAACHRFGVLAARLAEMTVQVDQAWQGDQPFGIESLDVRPGLGRIGQDAVAQQQVCAAAADAVPRR